MRHPYFKTDPRFDVLEHPLTSVAVGYNLIADERETAEETPIETQTFELNNAGLVLADELPYRKALLVFSIPLYTPNCPLPTPRRVG